jgi:hypothetical protein
MRAGIVMTKKQRREYQRRPKTLTRIKVDAPPAAPAPRKLPEGWIACPYCGNDLQIEALCVVRMYEQGLPHEAKCAVEGYFCPYPQCAQPIWGHHAPRDESPWLKEAPATPLPPIDLTPLPWPSDDLG